MLEGSSIAVIVPAYNVSRTIARVVRTMPAFVDRIIVIDDGSADATAAVVESLNDSRVVLVRHGDNQGVGGAITTGYLLTRAHSFDVAAVMAGDGQMHPGDLCDLVLPVVRGSADYAKGNRLLHRDVARAMPWARWVGNSFLSAFTRLATGLRHIGDSQCGYTAIHRRVWRVLDPSAMWSRYGYPNHLLGALALHDFRVVDVVVRAVYDGERSGVRVRDALITVPRILAAVARVRRRSAAREIEAPGGFAVIR